MTIALIVIIIMLIWISRQISNAHMENDIKLDNIQNKLDEVFPDRDYTDDNF